MGIDFYPSLPIRMNEVPVIIAIRTTDASKLDRHYKQRTSSKGNLNTYKEKPVSCQNNRRTADRKLANRTGDEVPTVGHLVFKRVYYDSLGFKIRKGDRVVKIEDEEVNYEITEVRSESALGGRQKLVFVHYGGAPERQSIQ